LTLLLRGGNFNLLGQTFNVLGLKNTQRVLEAVRPQLPANSPFAGALDRVIQFSRLARQNLNLAQPLLASIAHPIAIQKEVVSGGGAFAAFGAAIGGAAREVRASSLLAFMVSLPIAFVSLVDSGTVSPGLFDVIKVLRAVFPFHAALDAMSGGLDAAGPALGG